jgi:protein tyrosine phosphatase (PTP) superfamily phosphohydrolase (DUF442 family)
MTLLDIHNYIPIDGRLATAGQPSEEQLREVATAGYTSVINLGLLDTRYCLPDERGLVAALGLAYQHIPVSFESPAVADFATFLKSMDRSAEERVLVHCAANYRVSTFMALYGELRLGWTHTEADAHARRFWEPNQTWRKLRADCRDAFVSS